MKIVDTLVIGSGPSGSITAFELINAKRNVLLIEAGSHHTLDSCKPYSTLEMEQKYKYGGLTPAYGNPKLSYVEGSCVGGGSEVNSGFYHRTPNSILESWKNDYHIKDFSTESLIKHFEVIENKISVSSIPEPSSVAKASLKLKEGADKLGWKSMEVPRWFKFNKKNQGIKQSMTNTYVKWYLDKGGELLSDMLATKIKFFKKKWMVTCSEKNSKNELIIMAKNVFLCGGAISTPFLLRSSGIKNNIGNSLQMHPTIKAIAEFDEVVNYHDMGVPVHQVKEFSPKISFGCSISSKPFLTLAMLDNEQYLGKVEKNWQKMAIYYGAIKPSGYGTVRKLPFFKDPFVRYHITENDLMILSDALKKMCLILFKAGAKFIYPSIKDYGLIKNENDIHKIPEKLDRFKTGLMTIHLFSSCPMGENRKLCAVDSYGEIFEHKNLYVNDGSLIPSAPGVNPQGTIMAIARRNVHKFLGIE